jgi:hypothetical protein
MVVVFFQFSSSGTHLINCGGEELKEQNLYSNDDHEFMNIVANLGVNKRNLLCYMFY